MEYLIIECLFENEMLKREYQSTNNQNISIRASLLALSTLQLEDDNNDKNNTNNSNTNDNPKG